MATPRNNNRRGNSSIQVKEEQVEELPEEEQVEELPEETPKQIQAREDYNRVLIGQIKSFGLYKKQALADTLMQKGKMQALQSMNDTLLVGIKARYLQREKKKKNFKDDETSLEKFNIDVHGKFSKEIYDIYLLNKNKLTQEHEKLTTLQAIERIMEVMDSDLEGEINALSLLQEVRDRSIDVFPLDVQARLKIGLCGYKRPGGRTVFPCSNKPVDGTKYCKEHLKKHDRSKYYEIFKTEEINEKDYSDENE